MMTRIRLFATRFSRNEDGNASIEFVFYFTVLFAILASSVEIGIINLRHAMLERAVDMAVRDIRLNTGDIPSYNDLRTAICTEAHVADSCEANLRLEMKQVDPRNFDGLPTVPDCINAEEDPHPVREFTPGEDNDLMLLRVCLKYKPFFPTAKFAKSLTTDSQGYAQLVVRSAFVQEPR